MALSETGDVKSDVICAKCHDIDPDLAVVVAAWPKLPEAVKRQVVATVRATGSK